MILSIETSTSNCSVALHNAAGELVGVKEHNEPNVHASQLFVFIHELLNDHKIQFSQLKAVAVSKGPGSYTGLRIGVSAAKGLCYSLNLPLLSVHTLAGMAHSAKLQMADEKAVLIPMIDARRMEVYNAVYDMNLNEVIPTQATIIDGQSFDEFQNKACYFFGDGMPKCRDILSFRTNWFFVEGVEASATAIGFLAHQKYVQKQFENLAYFEPFYLKEFVTQSTFHQK
ncbi:MAG: tRNA (adenosine(37)-N6)-threonylcarbamoyltransferase complex dimerization subunit type 1 TsaB [Bacteroidetes bacterium]|nr:tRNA (adenosine(37)-N6)-threonylcarbamoyltransferase complex dimerization subunit type 1 TsaB [Bacteroidota bacterium]